MQFGKSTLWKGVAYYPEYWPRERWAIDLGKMRELGMNLVRVGEFAWDSLEPQEGQYQTDWLRDFLKLIKDFDMQAMLCTPTACPPQWMTHRYPDVRVVNALGQRSETNCRKHYCCHSENYQRFIGHMLERLVVIANEAGTVAAWQIDNELGPHEEKFCYCQTCNLKYREWLRVRYGSLANLNLAWKTAYWSQQISDWDEIELPTTKEEPAAMLAVRRFVHESERGFYQHQKSYLLKAGVKVPITTNFMGPTYEQLDYWDFAKQVDIAAYDGYFHNYHPASVSLGFDVFRNLRRDYFCLTETGTCGRHSDSSNASELRLWAYNALARGCRGVIYFRWRTALSGKEFEHPAILTHQGTPTRSYEEITHLFAEWKQHEDILLKLPLPKCEVAIAFDWEALLAAAQPNKLNNSSIEAIEEQVFSLYDALRKMGLTVDIIPPMRSLEQYRLVILPGLALPILHPKWAKALEKFVADGGTLVGTAGLFSKDECGNYHEDELPGALSKIFGLTIGETRRHFPGSIKFWYRKPDEIQVVMNEIAESMIPGQSSEELRLDTAKPLARYKGGYFDGKPAVTTACYNAGTAIYMAITPQAKLSRALWEYALKAAQIAFIKDLPEGVECVDCSPYRLYLNTSEKPVRTTLARPAVAVIGEIEGDQAVLDAFDICLVIEEN